ncbi:ATP-binding protein [Patescibacteria group bacterium]|nr:ATP-binding protein [Patescibacteria group bacterium]
MFKRQIEADIDRYLKSKNHKILFIWGPRRSGKTVLLNKLAEKLQVKRYNFDWQSDREKFVPRREILASLVKTNPVILIDEVQSYPEATVAIKLLHDEFKIKIIATGSSELRQKSKEFDSLAGRYNEIFCLPLALEEIWLNQKPEADEAAGFKNRLAEKLQIFGAYPEVYTQTKLAERERINLLQKIFDAYVLKDVVDIYALKNQKLAKDILTKIALQLGSEVSVREIANSLGASPSTVADYIEIFIKNYILIPLPSFKTNLRRAVSANRKLYFYDLGIRNILIRDFRETGLRQDSGGVWENLILAELEKKRLLEHRHYNFYFYREYSGREIDLIIEDYQKNYTALEIKAKRGGIKNIFPLPARKIIISRQNYYDELKKL